MEERDHYFTKLQNSIELLKLANENRKVVLVTHSLGGNIGPRQREETTERERDRKTEREERRVAFQSAFVTSSCVCVCGCVVAENLHSLMEYAS